MFQRTAVLVIFLIATVAISAKEVSLPITNNASYPFHDSSYKIKVLDVNSGQVVTFIGQITKIYYGFTKESKRSYLANNNIDWIDFNGNQGHEGEIETIHRKVPSNNDQIEMSPILIDVPKNMKVLFRIIFDRPSPPNWVERGMETKAYYFDPKFN